MSKQLDTEHHILCSMIWNTHSNTPATWIHAAVMLERCQYQGPCPCNWTPNIIFFAAFLVLVPSPDGKYCYALFFNLYVHLCDGMTKQAFDNYLSKQSRRRWLLQTLSFCLFVCGCLSRFFDFTCICWFQYLWDGFLLRTWKMCWPLNPIDCISISWKPICDDVV